MSRQWEAEQTITPQTALALIQEQFPELKAETIRFLGSGWDNTVFIIDEKLIFRFPRREIALPLLETEWLFLPRLAPRLPLPIPTPKWKGKSSKSFPWPFIGYPMLAGKTACYVDLPENERAALAEPIARFLAALHATPQSEIAHCHIPHDNLGRVDAAQLVLKIDTTLNELIELGLLGPQIRFKSIVEKTAKAARKPEASAIVHGDFYVRHLLVDEKHHLAGVIDWGDVHYGDPAIDLAIAHSFLPTSAHATFREIYGAISEETRQLAKLRAIHSSGLLAIFGHHSGDIALTREGLRALKSFFF